MNHTHISHADVQLVNLTPIVYHKDNDKVIFQCSITGLDSDENDFDIQFHVHKHKHDQQQPNGHNELQSSYTNNGTICELHIPNANASHSGDYYCKVKIHTHESKECMVVQTQPKTLSIDIPNTGNDNKVLLATTIALSAFIFLSIIIIIITIVIYNILCMYKRKKRQRHQQEHEQPGQLPGQQQQLLPAQEGQQPPPRQQLQMPGDERRPLSPDRGTH